MKKIEDKKTLLVKLPKEEWDIAVRIVQNEVRARDVMLTKTFSTFKTLNKDALQDVLDHLVEWGY